MKSLQERLTEFHLDRQEPSLALKYKLMTSDAFTFYRGTCHLFYEDLSALPSFASGPPVWCCGDLHLENFGSYRADNGLVYFDINDFDEGILAPATWELVRFLCSIGMAADLWQYSMKEAEQLMILVLKVYAHQIAGGKAFAIERETSPPLIQEFFAKAEKQREKELIKVRVNRKKEELKIIDGKTIALSAAVYKQVKEEVKTFLSEQYGFFKVKDIAFRLAGTGSLGIKRYVVLVEDKRQDKLRLLDLKEAKPSSLQNYVPTKQPGWKSEADRILTIQGMMQYALPRFITSLNIDGQNFILKQMQPSSQKIDHRLCNKKLKNVETVMTLMAQTIASAHLRSAARKGSANIETLMQFVDSILWQNELIQTSMDCTVTMKKYFKEFQKMK